MVDIGLVLVKYRLTHVNMRLTVWIDKTMKKKKKKKKSNNSSILCKNLLSSGRKRK